MKANERTQKILEILSNANGPVYSAYITKSLGISKRTLIKDIQEINQSKELITSTKKGYVLNHDEEYEINYLLSTNDNDLETQMLKYLLSINKAISINYISNKFNISLSQLSKCVNNINFRLQDYDMSIKRKNNEIYLYGEENKKRLLIGRIMHKESNDFFMDLDNLDEYFPGFSVSKTAEIINTILDQNNYRVKEYYSINFLINLLVIISRSSYHKGIRETDYEMPEIYEETHVARKLVETIESNYLIVYDDSKKIISELDVVMHGFIENKENTTAVSSIHLLADEFIAKIRNILQNTFDYYHLNINYESFLNVFCMHIDELIKRSNVSINYVPSKLSIKQTDPFVFDVAVYIAQRLNKEFNIKIPDSEINLIAIHIGYAIKQADSYIDRPMITIISNNYQNIADKIITQIRQIYGQQFEIDKVYENINDIPLTVASNSFIISTSKPTQSPFNICYISPFFTLEDQKRISEKLIIYLKIMKNREFSHLLFQYSDYSRFIIKNDKETKKEVIHELSQLAILNGDVNDDFEQHVLTREELSSTAFYNKFAIPHSDKQEAKTTKLYIMINKKGIVWDDQTVYIVFLIVLENKSSAEFRKLYNIIIETLYHDDSLLLNINKINSISDFIRYLSTSN